MIFSKQVTDNVLDFIKNNLDYSGIADNFNTALVTIGTQYGVTIDPLKWFDLTAPIPAQWPAGVLYEEPTTYRQETLSTYVKQYHFVLMFADQELSIDRVRNNLYAYRDASTYLVEKYGDLHGICSQVINPQLNPATIWKDTGSYSGVINYKFIVEII